MNKELADLVVETNSNPAVTSKFKSDPENAATDMGMTGLKIENELGSQSNSSAKNVKGLMLTIHS